MDVTDTVDTSTATTIQSKGQFTYLALGDSYTIGQSVTQDQSFPYQLKADLHSDNYTLLDPNIIAVTGWTTQNLINAINQANLNKKFDIVTLLIGVNNQYQGLREDDYRNDFDQLLTTAIAFANGNKKRVFVLSIPDYSVTPYAIGRNSAVIATQIAQFNSINLYESTKAGVNYLNITDISQRAATDPLLIAIDGLHPSGKMYSLWMSRLAPMVEAQLK